MAGCGVVHVLGKEWISEETANGKRGVRININKAVHVWRG